MTQIWRGVSMIVVFLGLICLSGLQVLAANTGFTTSVDSTYIIDHSGQTQVSHVFELKNTTARSFVKEYTLELTGSPLTSIVASNQDAPLTPTVTHNNARTQITLTFPNDVVGEGQARRFSIRYNSPDVAVITGQVLEVRVPGIAPGSEYQHRSVTLLTPQDFGQPVRISPIPSKVTQTNSFIRSQFDDIGNQAISVFFGQSQTYNLSFVYELENELDRVELQEIALPPDTGWQRMVYHQLTPLPINIRSDLDGNWLATYSLKPGEKLNVVASASAHLTLSRDPNVYASPPLTVYTAAQPYWPTNGTLVGDVASKYNSVQALYKFVVNTLAYPNSLDNFEIRRRSAEDILKKPQGSICQDFTDVFVTLLRSKGIPARRQTGFGYAQNEKLRPNLPTGDILHAWPEFYDNSLGTWHSVDPTWENTTDGVDYFTQFDLSHITFAINGVSSQSPAPAGAYHLPGDNKNSVYVTPTKDWQTQNLDLTMTIVPRKWLFWPIPGQAKMILQNKTGQGWYDVAINVSAENPDVDVNLSSSRLTSLLPFDQVTIPLNLYDQTNRFQTTSLKLVATVQDQEVRISAPAQIRSVPAGIKQVSWQLTGIGLAAGLVSIPLGAGSLLVYRAKKRSALRGQSQTVTPAPPIVS